MINSNSQEGCDIPVSAGLAEIAVDNVSGSVTFFAEYWIKGIQGYDYGSIEVSISVFCKRQGISLKALHASKLITIFKVWVQISRMSRSSLLSQR